MVSWTRWSVGPGGQRDQEHGVVLHVQGEGYQPPITFRRGSSQVPQGLSMTPLPTQVDQVDSKIKGYLTVGELVFLDEENLDGKNLDYQHLDHTLI